jgi:hypothetical protein
METSGLESKDFGMASDTKIDDHDVTDHADYWTLLDELADAKAEVEELAELKAQVTKLANYVDEMFYDWDMWKMRIKDQVRKIQSLA